MEVNFCQIAIARRVRVQLWITRRVPRSFFSEIIVAMGKVLAPFSFLPPKTPFPMDWLLDYYSIVVRLGLVGLARELGYL